MISEENIRQKLKLLAAYLITIIAVGGTILTIYVVLVEKEESDKRLYSLIASDQFKEELDSLRNYQKNLDNLLKVTTDIPIESLELKSLEQNINQLSNKVDEIEQTTRGLRQAVNPLNPDEILTIARLTDAINTLNKRFESFEKKVQNEQINFKNSILRELDSSDKATNLIVVVLIPLVLNLIYSILKDRKKSQL